MFKNLLRISLLLSLSSLLTACFPPTFYSVVNLYAEQDESSPGGDVTFTIKVGNSPTSVKCFGGSITMTNTSGDSFQGTAIQPTHLVLGQNKINCTAYNDFGSLTSDVGAITIVDSAPTVVMLPTVTVNDNCGTESIDVILIDTATSSDLGGATYALGATSAALTSPLTINASTGRLVGIPPVGTYSDISLIINAENAAGNTDSSSFTVNYDHSSCP